MSFFRHGHKHDDHHRHDPPPTSHPPPPTYPPQSSYPPQQSYPPHPSYPPQHSSYPPQDSYPSQPIHQSQHGHYPQHGYQPQPPYPLHQAPATHFAGDVANNSTFRIYTKAGENYSLSIRDGTVVLAPTNPRDDYQHWYKDFRWASQVKDEEGLPAFALINKATGLAIKHSLGPTKPVRLIPFNSDYMDESVLWSESHDTGEGYRCIRMVNNIRLNFDAFHGDKDHGGVHDGTTIVLWEWAKGKNQRWKIVPYY